MAFEDESSNKTTMFIISTVGAIIVSSTIIHVLYTQILPLTELTSAIFLMLPAVYIGVLNEDIKRSMLSMTLTTVGIVVLSSFTLSLPAFVGVFPYSNDLFIFQQITETIPLLFLVIPFLTIGTIIGVIINEFKLKKSRY
ncbi:MAG: hypothetical protein ACFFB2_03660 [Promethearchaeota archaeon]